MSEGKPKRNKVVLTGVALLMYGWVVLRFFVLFWIVSFFLKGAYDWRGALLLAVTASLAALAWRLHKARQERASGHKPT